MATVIKAGNVASGAQVTPDATGILQFNTGSGAGTAAMTIDTSQNVAVAGNLSVDGNTTLGNANTDTILMTAAPSIGGAGLGMGFGFRNRIINGAMVIDQRNAGASISVSSNSGTQFGADRFLVQGTSAEGVFSAQQLSSTPPTGFRNYVRIQTTTASASPASGSLYAMSQIIEGFNIADLGFGAAGASTVTFSFWIRSSLTGTFSGSLKNGNAYNRSYPFTYTINAANTWEYKTVTVAGDTTGTWQTGNLGGLIVYWDLGCGSSLLSTANSWQAGNFNGVTGSTRLISTLNATLDITGVQLEKGSTATSFDYRPYGTELQLCQRYYYRITSGSAGNRIGMGQAYSGTNALGFTPFPVTMRVAPTALEQTGTAANYQVTNSALAAQNCSAVPTFNNADVFQANTIFTVASGLTAGNACLYVTASANIYLGWSAEL